MDIKDLNRSQLILLALLLSFVTSLATGITTVTLMQQAPDSVTVPINNIVRETVQKIVPSNDKSVTTNTVIIKEEDLVVGAISNARLAEFSILKEAKDLTEEVVEVDMGKGFAISQDGIVVTDSFSASGNEVYYVKNESGKFRADFVSGGKDGFAFLKIGAPVNPTSKLTFTEVKLGRINTMKAGQKIIVMSNDISSFIFTGDPNINTDAIKPSLNSVVLNLNEETLGFFFPKSSQKFIPATQVDEALKSIQNTQ